MQAAPGDCKEGRGGSKHSHVSMGPSDGGGQQPPPDSHLPIATEIPVLSRAFAQACPVLTRAEGQMKVSLQQRKPLVVLGGL